MNDSKICCFANCLGHATFINRDLACTYFLHRFWAGFEGGDCWLESGGEGVFSPGSNLPMSSLHTPSLVTWPEARFGSRDGCIMPLRNLKLLAQDMLQTFTEHRHFPQGATPSAGHFRNYCLFAYRYIENIDVIGIVSTPVFIIKGSFHFYVQNRKNCNSRDLKT